jgi:hypothetical protein
MISFLTTLLAQLPVYFGLFVCVHHLPLLLRTPAPSLISPYYLHHTLGLFKAQPSFFTVSDALLLFLPTLLRRLATPIHTHPGLWVCLSVRLSVCLPCRTRIQYSETRYHLPTMSNDTELSTPENGLTAMTAAYMDTMLDDPHFRRCWRLQSCGDCLVRESDCTWCPFVSWRPAHLLCAVHLFVVSCHVGRHGGRKRSVT